MGPRINHLAAIVPGRRNLGGPPERLAEPKIFTQARQPAQPLLAAGAVSGWALSTSGALDLNCDNGKSSALCMSGA
jgi:hypothetical protein